MTLTAFANFSRGGTQRNSDQKGNYNSNSAEQIILIRVFGVYPWLIKVRLFILAGFLIRVFRVYPWLNNYPARIPHYSHCYFAVQVLSFTYPRRILEEE